MACDLILVNYASALDAKTAILSARHCLRPILNRIIVIENGTGEAEEFRRIGCEVIEFSENKGFAYAVNAGISASLRSKRPPKHVMLINPDAYLLPGPWLRFFSWIVPEVAAAGPAVLSMSGEIQASVYSEPQPFKIVMELLGAQKIIRCIGIKRSMPILNTQVDTLQGSCIVISLNAWKKIGPFDENFFMYHEETDWCLRARDAGFYNIYDPSVSIVHKGGIEVPSGRELMYFRSAVHLVAKRRGESEAQRLRNNLRRAARIKSIFEFDSRRKEALIRVGMEL